MTYNSAEEICYTPEKAVEWSAQAAWEIEDHVRKLDVRSSAKLRSKDVWLRDIKNFKEQTLPRTLIAVCGATGAGKSSLINALLEACTAVATEVSYHDKSTIEAKIEFITWDEWRHELEALIHDLKTKRRGDAGSLWQKIHAVYPGLTAEDFVATSPDDIIRSNRQVADLLGTSVEVKSPDSADFSLKIARYIDSPKRIVTAAVTGQENPETPLWPLIRVVQVAVKADVLKSGATLVDLPGLGDSNLARCNVANEYIKKCDYIWIVSNIQRAVDENIARNLQDDFFKAQIMMDGHYNGNKISFVMTKSDELDPDEIIQGMGLRNLPGLVELEEQIDCASQEKDEHDAVVKEARTETQKTMAHIAELESDINKYKIRLSPTVIKTEQLPDPPISEATNPNSRKRQHESESHANKRARTDGELAAANQGEAGHSMDLDEPKIQDNARNSTQATWKAFIDRKERNLAHANEQLQHLHRTRLEAETQLNECQQTIKKLVKLRHAFCSRKRNEYVKNVATEDFLMGLEQFGQHGASDDEDEEMADAGERLPIPNTSGLTVFTCSSRDYIRTSGRAGSNSEATCYTDIEDTEIPKLQRWCHTIATSPRQKLAYSVLKEIIEAFKAIVSGTSVDTREEINISDRLKLSELWESDLHIERTNDPLLLVQDKLHEPDSKPGTARTSRRRREIDVRLESPEPLLSNMADEARKLLRIESRGVHDNSPARKGVAAQLHPKLRRVATDCVKNLRKSFQRIQHSCDIGVNQAIEAALETSDRCAKDLRHPTHHAIIRRHGEWRAINWNAEMAKPLSQAIATPWGRVFHPDRDLFSATLQDAKKHIDGLLANLVKSAPDHLKSRCESRRHSAIEEAELVIKSTLRKLKSVIETEQKSISRCLVPTVRTELEPVYQLALQDQGKGCLARRKQLIHEHVEEDADTIFGTCSKTLFDKLDEVAKSVGNLLEISFSNLSEKVEANVSVLWDIPSKDKAAISHQIELGQRARSILVQLEYWRAASEMWEAARERDSGKDN